MESKRVGYWFLAFIVMGVSWYLGSMLPYDLEALKNNVGTISDKLIPIEQVNELAKQISNYIWGSMALIPLVISLLTLATVAAVSLYFRVYRVEGE